MSTITTRSGKGSPLTNNEIDSNFTNLNTDKYESGDSPSFAGLTVASSDSYAIDVSRPTAGNTTLRITGGSTAGNDAVLRADIANTSGSTGLYFGDSDTSGIGRIMYEHSGDYMRFYTSSTEQLRIDSSGNVGIGITNPSTKLDVSGTVNATSFTGSGSSLTGLVSETASTGSAEIPSGTTAQRDGSPAAGYLRFNTDDTQFEGYDGSAWAAIGAGGGGGASAIDDLSDALTNSSGQEIGVGTGALTTSDGSFRYNTAFGYQALTALTSGEKNVAVGHSALKSITSGRYSTAVGYQAGQNVTGWSNTLVGYQAGSAITSGTYNQCMGDGAGAGITTSNHNVAIGYGTMNSSNSASGVCIGHGAGLSPTNIGNSVLIGQYTGYLASNVTGSIYIGYRGGWSASAGSNTGVGYYALGSVGAGGNNAAFGYYALQALSTGTGNTGLGYQAGDGITTGNNNTCLGQGSDPSSGTVSDEVVLGNNSVTTLRCNTSTISSLSDARDKTDVEDLSLGLDFINTLRPVKFSWDRRDGSMSGKKDTGFIAQELDEAQQNANAEEYLNMVLKTNPEKLEAAPGKLIPVLVKAIQELSAEIADLKQQLNN